jgi:uncharacterized protein YbjQ (UPF0145 family)
MADCSKCGKKIGFFERIPSSDMCEGCLDEVKAIRLVGQQAVASKAANERAELDAAIASVVLTTETYPQGLVILERIEIVTAECAFGMNMFKDLFAGVRDIVGGRSEAVQKTMRDSRRTALYELKREAHAVGANAVVGVDLDYVELSGVGNMVLLVASGTAVRIEK